MVIKHSKVNKEKVAKVATSALLCAMMLSSPLCGVNGVFASAAEASSTAKKYYTDFATYEALEEAGSDIAIQIASEGATLLKNENNALPLSESETKVSVFGAYSDNIRQAGGGAGGGSSARSKTLADSLTAAGFEMNPMLTGYYQNQGNPANETDPAELVPYEASFSSYGDAAIIVVSRSGSEMRDIAINEQGNGKPLAGHEADEHMLMLETNEKALIEYVKSTGQFEKIVVVLNTPAAMEIANLEDDDAVDSILWIGLTGAEGIMALGKVLNGEVNPSGRTVDIYSATFDTDPTWFNVSHNGHTGSSSTVLDKNGEVYAKAGNNVNGNYASLDYEEGIYMGYRFYETAGAEGLTALATTAVGQTQKNVYEKDVETDLTEYLPEGEDDLYYNRYNGVLYPYGYGLSYTDFEWTILSEDATITNANKNAVIEVKVEVKNVGNVAGKDVVQLYAEPEYYAGGIEKASKNLVTFEKTGMLQPGESEVVTLRFTAFELASFDDIDANGNGLATYELEAGVTKVYVSENSHEYKGEPIEYTVAEDTTKAATAGKTGIVWNEDPVTGAEINAVFSQNDTLKNADGGYNNQYSNTRRTAEVMAENGTPLAFMSRNNWTGTFPTKPAAADLMFSDDALAYLDQERTYFAYQDRETDPWYVEADEIPEDWTQAVAADREEGEKAAIQLYDMSGVDLDDDKWTTFMNQLTYDEMKSLISATGFQTIAIDYIGKPKATDSDGASQLGQNSTNTYWPAACVLGSTYNTDLGELYGIIVGNESIYTNRQGWYAPSMNIHRSPFSGRNFEYYGQDGVHSGIIAASVVKGVTSKGVVVYLKHLALNDQEQNRQLNGGVITWSSEQAIREIYLRPYEYCIKFAGANGTMTSFNRIGMMPSASNYALYQDVVAKEWGFDGYSITDMYAGGSAYWAGNLMVRCGTGPLGTYSAPRTIEGTWDAEKQMVMVSDGWTNTDADGKVSAGNLVASDTLMESPTQWYVVRMTAMKLLKVAADSNLMSNGNRIPLNAFTEGTSLAVAGGWGTSAQPEVRKELTGFVVGTEAEYDIRLDAETLYDDVAVTYSVADGELPAGLTLKNGVISGTPTEAGEYDVTLTATIEENHISANKVVKFIVTGGEDDTPVQPAGPEFKVEEGVIKYNNGDGNWIDVIAVSELKGADGTSGVGISKVEESEKGFVITMTDGSTFEYEVAGDSGCGSTVAGTAVVGLALAFASAVVLKKRKEDNE